MRYLLARPLRIALVLLMVGGVVLAGRISAQPTVPGNVYVRDSQGQIWLVSADGARYRVPIYPASDQEIAALPNTGLWVVPDTDRGVAVIGPKPFWAWEELWPPEYQAKQLPAPAAQPASVPQSLNQPVIARVGSSSSSDRDNDNEDSNDNDDDDRDNDDDNDSNDNDDFSQTFNTNQSGPIAICNDGTVSFSQTRDGACANQGGVRVWLR